VVSIRSSAFVSACARLRFSQVSLCLLTVLWVNGARAQQSASAGVYVRQDSNATRVISPRVKLRAPIAGDETHLDASYAVDVWTSASVDIVASASQPVTEQRDELNVALDRVFGDFKLAGAYRFSKEPDYESHGGSISASLDIANKAATLSWFAGGSSDRVGRVGDPNFVEQASTLTSGLSLTQLLDAQTVVQLLYDIAQVRGYQASAYRYVAFGTAGPCRALTALCLPERAPRERVRHALSLRVRRALSAEWSLGASYRFYLDDWSVLSHTAKADIAWAPQLKSTIALSYRFYSQSAADFYRPMYTEQEVGRAHFTRDRELSPLSTHRVALEFDWLWELGKGGSDLMTAIAIAPTFYSYADFPMLQQVTAIEVTAATGMEFP
jgi:hypothetical protein